MNHFFIQLYKLIIQSTVFNNITEIGKHNIINLLDRIAIELNVSLYDLYYEDFYAMDQIVQVIYRRLRKER